MQVSTTVLAGEPTAQHSVQPHHSSTVTGDGYAVVQLLGTARVRLAADNLGLVAA